MSALIEFEPNTEAIRQNPYPAYASIRELDPIHWNGSLNGWMITRHEDLRNMFTHTMLTAKRTRGLLSKVPKGVDMTETGEMLERWLLTNESPFHGRIRAPFEKAFSMRVVKNLRPKIQATTEACIDNILKNDRCDLIKELAHPLPISVITDLLGLPSRDVEQLKQWSSGVGALTATAEPSAELCTNTNNCVKSAYAYFREVIDKKRLLLKKKSALGKNNLQDIDLICNLILGMEEDPDLGIESVLSNCLLLMVAGHETTTGLIGNSLLTLIRHPELIDNLNRCTDPEQKENLVTDMIEEILRYESPVAWMSRQVKDDFTYKGLAFQKGQMVFLMIGSGNRDEEAFTKPEELVIERRQLYPKDKRHMAFGHGMHHCLGDHLGRLQAQIAVPMVLGKIKSVVLIDEQPDWRHDLAFRGVRTLWVGYDR